MRELRVEDALLYLDQVKVEFGDRPHIYNEFLDIMKTFKTQQIDTPGVIRRVSNLFQGNRRLVLGFNTFLPEGYKIEIDGEGPPVAVYRAPGSSITHVLRESAESQAVSVAQVALAARPGGTGLGFPQVDQIDGRITPSGWYQPPGNSTTSSQQQQQQQPHPNDAPSGGTSSPNQQQPNSAVIRKMAPTIKMPPLYDAGGVVPRPPPPPQTQQQQQQPQQYHQQLPGGVAPRQQQLPQKHIPRMQPPLPGLNGQPQMPQPQQSSPSPPAHFPPQRAAPTGFAVGTADPQPNNSNAAPAQPPLEFDHAINYVTTIKRRFAAEPETYKKFLEILHTYQKEQRGIKEVLDEVSELFQEHPDLLKEFTFFLPDAVQAQAKAQLDQAAKEAEARKRSKATNAIMNQAQGMQRQAQAMRMQTGARPLPTVSSDSSAPHGAAFAHPTRSNVERETSMSRGAQFGVVLFDPVRPPRKNGLTPAMAASKYGRPTNIPDIPTMPSTTEAAFFERVKTHLGRRELASDKPPGSRRHTPYVEFLKCLHLFGVGVLSKEELVTLLKHLFLQGHAPKTGVNATGGNHNPLVAHDASELMHDLEEILVGRGPVAAQQRSLKDKSAYGTIRTRDFDFTDCAHPTPSYWAYPSDYPSSLFLSFPGQTTMDASFINSKLVCVDSSVVTDSTEHQAAAADNNVGSNKRSRSAEQLRKRKAFSIEESDASKLRHNGYEDTMARIEEERYEMDLAIERNLHALRRIEPFAKEVQTFREQEEKDGQPIGRLRYQLHRHALNSIHINAIARIYGDRGDEVLQHLVRNPLVVLPIVYERLKQKDVEWRKAKAEMTEEWNALATANYEGSLDVLCYPNRKALEKSFTASRLLDECMRARSFAKHPEKIKSHPAAAPFQPSFAKRSSDVGAVMYQPLLETECRVDWGHKIALELVAHKINRAVGVSAYDRERMGRIWAEFVAPWFQYPVHWVQAEVRKSVGNALKNPSVTKFAAGQRVVTTFGEGTITSFMEATAVLGPRYRVKLSYGLAHLTPSAILYAIPSRDAPFIRRDGVMVRDEASLDVEGSGTALNCKYQLLFGTDKIYLFMRMYTLLCSVLSDIRDHCLAFPSTTDPASLYVSPSRHCESPKPVVKLDFASVLAALKKVLDGRMTIRDYETLGRKVAREKVHEIAALPKFVDRCADAMHKMAEEEALLHLFDYCQYRDDRVDPVALRTQCLAVVPDASYRIQFDSSIGSISYSYLETGLPLLTAAGLDEVDDANEMMEEETNMDTGDEDLMDAEDTAMMDDANPTEYDQLSSPQNGGFVAEEAPTLEPNAKRPRMD